MGSNFETAFKKTMGHEGGYVNDPDDKGGETFRGISRIHHPDWNGWSIIDDHLKQNKQPPDLDLLVQSFYKKHYWDKCKGDLLPHPIAEELFDTAVNMGVRTAGRFLQRSLNALNRNQTLYPDLKLDGVIGDATVNAVNQLLDEIPVLRKAMEISQGARYLEIMDKNQTQEKYARGWLERVSLR